MIREDELDHDMMLQAHASRQFVDPTPTLAQELQYGRGRRKRDTPAAAAAGATGAGGAGTITLSDDDEDAGGEDAG